MHKHPSCPTPQRAGLIAFFLATASIATAQTANYGGGSYNQNFDALAGTTWTNDSTVDGWSMSLNAVTPTVLATSSGTASNFVNALSLGTVDATDRALGFQPNTGNTHRIGLALTNSSGGALSSFDLGFKGEQWRAIGDAALTLTFEFQVFAGGTGSLAAATGWTAVTALNFVGPKSGVASTALDGNADGNFVSVSSTSNAVTWAAGEELWMRWTGASTPTNRRQMLGLDDVTFTASASAVPEPSTYALFGGIAALGFVVVRRRRSATAA